MEKDNLLDAFIAKQLKKSRGKLTDLDTKCPTEDIILGYIQGKRQSEEKKLIQHLLVCPECMQTLVALMDIEQAEKNLQEIPDELYAQAKNLLQEASAKQQVAKKAKTLIKKITLIWDKAGNTMSHLWEELEGMVALQGPIPQPARKYERHEQKKDLSDTSHNFPYCIKLETEIGSILFEIAHADKEGYLTLTISSLGPEDIPSGLGVRLYKGKIQRAAVSFAAGKALFYRLKEGSYRLEFFNNRGSIENIDIPILAK